MVLRTLPLRKYVEAFVDREAGSRKLLLQAALGFVTSGVRCQLPDGLGCGPVGVNSFFILVEPTERMYGIALTLAALSPYCKYE